MKKIQLDSVLLFAFVMPFIMTYRIGSGETPYWLFGLIFLNLLIYFILDVLTISSLLYFRLKQIFLWLIIVMVIGSAFLSAIVVRHKTHPIYQIHDIVIQQESAVYFLLHGKNPYATTYFDTALAQWNYSEKEVNPALYHFVMEPFYLLFTIPFYLVGNLTVGYFDGRMPLLFLFFSMLIVAAFFIKDKQKRLLFLVLLAFNPAMLGYTLEGRSDIFMFAFLFFGFYLLHKSKYMFSGIPIALAFTVKQSAWPLFPFYFAFLYFKTKSIKKTINALIPFTVTFLAIILPFFFWDKKAFIDSTILYLSGSTPHSYPISGYGVGMILYQMGIIKDLQGYYPFTIWQIVICLPLLAILIKIFKQTPNVSRLIFYYGIFLFVYWYFSRYFNNSHLSYLSMVFITAYFWPEENEKDIS